MAVDKLHGINPYESSVYGALGAKPEVKPEFTGQTSVTPGIHQGGAQTSGIDSVFKQSVKGFSQKVNPFAGENPAFKGAQANYQNGLSLFEQGALGDNAIYTKDGNQAGRKFNLIA